MAFPVSTFERAASLPVELTSFIGRRRERGEIRQLLAESRLVTLTGFGGIGKTRLSLSVADEVRRAFADGAYFVPLGTVSDPELVAQAIGAALGMQGRTTREASDSLTEYVGDKNVLLILDNCEHVIDSTAELVDMLLRACPQLHILATSREPLRIDGETVHAVAPLSIPVEGGIMPTPMHQFEAINLFIARAQAVVPTFVLNDDNREAVAEICRKLEGIPLAIELAAVRLRTMSPTELAKQLTHQWELLSRGSRTAPDRQRTMAGCIQWSFDLCSDIERDVWAGVSVFTGGFELDAASAVCADLDDTEEFTDVLASLVDKSIILTEERDNRMRFRMLPPIRHRGIIRLQELDLHKEYRRRHRDWYVGLATEVHDRWVSPRQVELIYRLRREEGNLQTALGFCYSEPGEAEPGLLMGAHLLEFGLVEGLFHPGRIWFGRLLPLAPGDTWTRMLALRTSCWWASMQGDLDHAIPLLEEGQTLARELGDDAETLMTQAAAFVAMFRGDPALSIELFEKATAEFRTQGDESQVVQCLALVSLAYTFTGDFDAALERHRQCLEITTPAQESWFRSYSMWIAGLAEWGRGNIEASIDIQKQSLQLKRPVNDAMGIALSLEALAWIVATTDPERAAILLGATQNQWTRIETSTEALPGLFAFHEQGMAAVMSELGQQAFDSAWDRGLSMSQSAVVEYALGERTPRTKSQAGNGPKVHAADILTKRENEVAGLVAQGMNNQDIAKSLVISKRTAETHVEHILTKLGFNSRTQIMAWVADQEESEPVTAASRWRAALQSR